jgi:Ti-type conjugative transfer relaxase TraA
LVQGAGADRRYCWDLTFSAPKSVSIAWALGSDKTRQAIEAAQQRAVAKTLEFIEQNFELARRGSNSNGGVCETEKVKLLAASFLHGASREQDMQIHSHLMFQNMAQRADGSWGALEPKLIFEWKLAIGAIYRSEEAQAMAEEGFKIEADGDSFRLDGIPKELEEEFSRRREQIEAKLDEKGYSGGKASERAALLSRKGKEVLDNEVLRAEWEKRALSYGVTREIIESLKTMGRQGIEAATLDRKELFQSLTSMESVFQEKDLWRATAVEMSHRGLGLEKVTQEVEEAKKDPEMVRLRGKDGKTYYTTREVLKTEKKILAMAEAGKRDQRHLLEKTLLDASVGRYEFRKGFSLSEEQKEAIQHMTSDVGHLQIVQGHAGAGKSTALTPVREAYEVAGFEVIGCALQGKTAAGLQSSTGIKSQTIHSMLNELEGYDREDGIRVEPSRTLDEKTVIVVDEAAMVGTRLIHRLQSQADKAGAKLILVGDEAQVPPVSAGSPFRSLKKTVGAVELTENRRQKKEWQQKASREIREGSVRDALMRYAKEQMIEVVETKEEAIETNVANWNRSFDPDKPADVILTSFRREDTARQNQAAREKMKERGILGTAEVTLLVRDRTGQSKGKRDFAQGDRIAFGKNDRKVGVMNGETGTVERVEKDKQGEWEFRVKKDDGKIVTFSPSSYSQIDHGYAITINKSQGMTAARSFNLVGGTGLEHLYVQMTRHEQGAHLVLVEDQIDRAAEEAGIELSPTEKMLEFMEKVADKKYIEVPEEAVTNFDACRKWLNSYAYRIGGDVGDAPELNFGLEKVASLIDSMGRSREKVNALDFDILDEKEKKEERSLGKEVQGKSEGRSMEAPSHEREHGKEEGSRPREREYKRELEMGF